MCIGIEASCPVCEVPLTLNLNGEENKDTTDLSAPKPPQPPSPPSKAPSKKNSILRRIGNLDEFQSR